jgi:hypothetical protein
MKPPFQPDPEEYPVELLPLDSPAIGLMTAFVKEHTLRKEEFVKLQEKLGTEIRTKNPEADKRLEIVEDLQEYILRIQDHATRILEETLAIASQTEASQIYRMLYWGFALDALGKPWLLIDYQDISFPRSLLPLNEEEWQEKAGPLIYSCNCYSCGKNFEQRFRSKQEYDNECDAVGTLYGHVIDLCQTCKINLPKTSGYVYLIQSPTKYFKIGRTKDPDDRIRTFEVKLPFEVEYVCLIKAFDMYRLEKELHEKYDNKRSNGEWFELTEADVMEIKEMARHIQ